MTYRVWNPDDCDEAEATAVHSAFDVGDVARWFAQAHDSDSWTDSPRTYHVRDDAGVLWAVEVRCEWEASFSSSKPQRVEPTNG